jgi:hypothetical protein
MKTRLIILVLLIACFSCGTNNKPLSDAQKAKIKEQVKEVVNTFIKGLEEANSNMVLTTYLDSPDFIYTYNGNTFGYKQVVDAMKSVFSSTLINQKGTIIEEKYAVLDNSTVLYTNSSKWLMNFKDGHSVLQDPWIVQLLFKKSDNKWKVISGNESGIEKIVKASETPKELNQVELWKKLSGTWKAEIAKDTSYIFEGKSSADEMRGIIKIVTKGKIIQEGKAIVGYDKKYDKLIDIELFKGADISLYAIWFTSKNTWERIPYEDISNPEKNTLKWKFEVKSPDLMIQTVIENNKQIGNNTFTRVK